MSRTLGPVGVVLAWLAAVAAATFVGVLAVGVIGDDIVPRAQEPMTPEEVRLRLASPAPASTVPPTAEPTTTPSSPTRAAPKALSSPGGVVYASCDPTAESGVVIVSVSPAQGYHLDDDDEEDGGRHVRFESGDSKVDLRITCTDGVPRAAVSTEPADDKDDD